jgi:MYXO-CTERM domain-containing protein
MIRALGVAILLTSVAGFAFGGISSTAPEIDASSGAAALGLLAGGLLILRSRRKKS